MDKCCDNCCNKKHCFAIKDVLLQKQAQIGDWDTSKDYCSKWEKELSNKEAIKKDIRDKVNYREQIGMPSGTLDTAIDYLKYRIEESLNNIEKEIQEGLFDITKNSYGLMSTTKKHLSWILGKENE